MSNDDVRKHYHKKLHIYVEFNYFFYIISLVQFFDAIINDKKPLK